MNFSNSYQLKSIIKEYENSFISENKSYNDIDPERRKYKILGVIIGFFKDTTINKKL
ncbi:hypothetical protein [Helicobacter trogontum]|uniref:hypothetical protein n=1 Tax=Helicobacter trogontum TaxID=50960 RepID=UPI000A71F501|nr:hypothetical protein [Helicobacter trogontum]MCI5786508.1 hypothetical protein [Helicobacter trogontum]MDY5185857.1 hypothetical protein [Helicobacter trogontum]